MDIKIQKSTVNFSSILLVLDFVINLIGIFNRFFSDIH
jgi:hypothetical protein